MPTAAEKLRNDPHIETIKRYYRACTAGDVDGVVACCTADVTQYMLEPGYTPVHGAEHLGRFWRKVVRIIGAEWNVEHAVACDDEAVIEFSMRWTSTQDGQRYIVHGAEWYVFKDDLISEIRAYSRHGSPEDSGLDGFPFAERGYSVINRTS